jgi:purine-binding chemotaxis protein CheW
MAENIREQIGNELQLVGFEVENEFYGVDILLVQEIIKEEYEITKIPNAPGYVIGIINLRGNVIPIIDLRKRFELVHEGDEGFIFHSRKKGTDLKESIALVGKRKKKTRKIIIIAKGNKRAGIIVDAVTQVIRVPRHYIEPPPPIISGVSSKFFEGIARIENKVIIIIDVDTIMVSEEVTEVK